MGAFIMSMGSLIDQIIIQRVLKELAVTNPQALIDQYGKYGFTESIVNDLLQFTLNFGVVMRQHLNLCSL